jgi:hypothetical protein
MSHEPFYRLLWVAVLFVIFQTPLILSRLWKSSHSLDLPLKLSWTEAASPTCVTEINRPTMPLHARRGPGHPLGFLTFGPGAHNAFEDHLAFMGFDSDPIASISALRRKASSILCLISLAGTRGLTRIVLVTPLSPFTRRTALSAADRW